YRGYQGFDLTNPDGTVLRSYRWEAAYGNAAQDAFDGLMANPSPQPWDDQMTLDQWLAHGFRPGGNPHLVIVSDQISLGFIRHFPHQRPTALGRTFRRMAVS